MGNPGSATLWCMSGSKITPTPDENNAYHEQWVWQCCWSVAMISRLQILPAWLKNRIQYNALLASIYWEALSWSQWHWTMPVQWLLESISPKSGVFLLPVILHLIGGWPGFLVTCVHPLFSLMGMRFSCLLKNVCALPRTIGRYIPIFLNVGGSFGYSWFYWN